MIDRNVSPLDVVVRRHAADRYLLYYIDGCFNSRPASSRDLRAPNANIIMSDGRPLIKRVHLVVMAYIRVNHVCITSRSRIHVPSPRFVDLMDDGDVAQQR